MKLNTDKIKQYVVDPNLETELRPLLLFNGSLSEGMAKTRFNFLRAAMDAEVPNLTELTKLSVGTNDDAHLCGFHAKSGWNRMGLQGFLGRMLQSPTVLAKVPGMADYIHWVIGNTHMAFVWKFKPIAETSYRTNRDWRRIARPRGPRKPRIGIAEIYPYITTTPTEDHELLLAIDRLVPKNLAHEIRADVCQDMLVAILTGEITLANLQDATPKFVKQIYRDMPSKYGHLSLDAPLIYGDGKSRTLGETIV